jgi:hypothetical protein
MFDERTESRKMPAEAQSHADGGDDAAVSCPDVMTVLQAVRLRR